MFSLETFLVEMRVQFACVHSDSPVPCYSLRILAREGTNGACQCVRRNTFFVHCPSKFVKAFG